MVGVAGEAVLVGVTGDAILGLAATVLVLLVAFVVAAGLGAGEDVLAVLGVGRGEVARQLFPVAETARVGVPLAAGVGWRCDLEAPVDEVLGLWSEEASAWIALAPRLRESISSRRLCRPATSI